MELSTTQAHLGPACGTPQQVGILPALDGDHLYLNLLLSGQLVQMALDVDQEGIQHVQDLKEDCAV